MVCVEVNWRGSGVWECGRVKVCANVGVYMCVSDVCRCGGVCRVGVCW
jgi:hypothetical protein